MSKIVMANIKMPISVNNGKLQPMSEYIKITLEKCDELPEKNKYNDGSLMSQIDKILTQQNNESHCSKDNESVEGHSHSVQQTIEPITKTLIVSLDELQSRRPNKTRQNMSFKNKSHRSLLKYTMKKRSSNSNTLDVDHSLPREVEE
jgi:hypothetical protein